MSIFGRRLQRGASQLTQVGLALPVTRLMDGTNAQLAADLDKVVEVGATWLRFDIYWNVWEKVQGTIDWTKGDRLIAAALQRNLKLIAVVHTVPPWSRPSTIINSSGQTVPAPDIYGPTTPEEQDNYASFVSRIASHYSGLLYAYEIWNEPNLDQFWAPSPSIANYCSLLQKAYTAIKQADPGVMVMSGGLGGAVTNDIPAYDFLVGMYDWGARQYFDAVATHPYTNFTGDTDGALWGAITRMRPLMDARGDNTKLLFGTETGAPTAGIDRPTITEEAQATLLKNSFSYWNSMHHAGTLFWFTLFDKDTTKTEDHMGIVRFDGSHKPAVEAMQQIK